jgi:hypothetical protein
LISAASWFPRIKCTLLGYSTYNSQTIFAELPSRSTAKFKVNQKDYLSGEGAITLHPTLKERERSSRTKIPSKQAEELWSPDCAGPDQHNLLGTDSRYI